MDPNRLPGAGRLTVETAGEQLDRRAMPRQGGDEFLRVYRTALATENRHAGISTDVSDPHLRDPTQRRRSHRPRGKPRAVEPRCVQYQTPARSAVAREWQAESAARCL